MNAVQTPTSARSRDNERSSRQLDVARTGTTSGVWLVAAATAAFHLGTAWIYGYHRDEVYYLASGRRLAWGYVDHPPLTPLLYRLSDELFGSSPVALRVVPAVLSAVVVLLTVRLARELGAGRRGQLLAAFAAAVAPMFLTLGHFLSTVHMEVVLWTLAAILVARLLKGGDARLWVAVGVVLGVGMLAKWTTVYFIAGVGVGLLATPARRLLASPWVAVGALAAVVIWVPNLLWQAERGWPQFALADEIRDFPLALSTVPFLIMALGAASFVAIPGFLWLARQPASQRFRPFAVAAVATVVLVMATGGKPYYAAVFAPVLIAAGAASGFGTRGWRVPAAMGVIAVLAAPFAMPLLPLSTAEATRKMNKEIGEMTGWDHVVDVVEQVYRQHPGATIFTANYSEAGVLEIVGRERGLPQPISGHNNYWYWGHPHGRSAETIVVGIPEQYLHRWFGDLRLAATIRTPGGVHNQEDGAPVWIAREQRVDWDTLWPDAKHFE